MTKSEYSRYLVECRAGTFKEWLPPDASHVPAWYINLGRERDVDVASIVTCEDIRVETITSADLLARKVVLGITSEMGRIYIDAESVTDSLRYLSEYGSIVCIVHTANSYWLTTLFASAEIAQCVESALAEASQYNAYGLYDLDELEAACVRPNVVRGRNGSLVPFPRVLPTYTMSECGDGMYERVASWGRAR